MLVEKKVFIKNFFLCRGERKEGENLSSQRGYRGPSFFFFSFEAFLVSVARVALKNNLSSAANIWILTMLGIV